MKKMKSQPTRQRSMAYMITSRLVLPRAAETGKARRQISFMAGKQDRGSVWQDFFCSFSPLVFTASFVQFLRSSAAP